MTSLFSCIKECITLSRCGIVLHTNSVTFLCVFKHMDNVTRDCLSLQDFYDNRLFINRINMAKNIIILKKISLAFLCHEVKCREIETYNNVSGKNSLKSFLRPCKIM